MSKSINSKIVLEDLVDEISSLQADNFFMHWDGSNSENVIAQKIDQLMAFFPTCDDFDLETVRRIAATAMYCEGDESIGLQGVELQIMAMLKKGEISAKNKLTGSPLVIGLAQDIVMKNFCVSASDAEHAKKFILPDRIFSNIAEKVEGGRYTLEEAAELLASVTNVPENFENVNEEASSSDRVGEDSNWIDLEMLKSAAMSGHLHTFQPGKDTRMNYDPLTDLAVREYYEEVRWFDLNNWLEKFHQNILFRFPNPDTQELNSTTKDQCKLGVEKKEILSVDWPMCQERGCSMPPMEKILNERPQWVATAWTNVGQRGGSSHLWNPAKLAICLTTRTTRKNWTVSEKKLTVFLADKFPDYLKDWEMFLEQL